MSFHLNDSKDIICDSLFLSDTNDILQNVLDLINAGGGGGSSGITTLTGSGAAIVTGTATSKNIQVDLSMYSTSTQINTLFSAYTNTTALNTLLSSYTSTTALNTALLSYTTLAFLTSVLSSYTVTTSMTTLLNAKQDTLTAGANITISGNTIASTGGGSGSWLILQLDGVNQTATTLNFIQNNAVLSNGVLNINRLN